jgi:hypothetical protein
MPDSHACQCSPATTTTRISNRSRRDVMFGLRNRLSPRYILYIATNGQTDIRWRGEPLIKQIKDKEHITHKTKTTKTKKRNRVDSGLHDDAPKKVTTQSAAAVETTRSRVFTRSRSVGMITTTTPLRGKRHPQASPPLALKR